MGKIPYRGKEIQPSDTVQGDDELNAFIKEHVKSAYHPGCSCLMDAAKGPMAVVDPQCRVIGTVNRGSSGQLGLLAKAGVALEVVAERGYFNSEEIVACERAGITLTLPKPPTSNATAQGRYGKRDFRYLAGADAYLCPAGERLTYRYTHEEKGLTLRRCWTNACQGCVVKDRCIAGRERPSSLDENSPRVLTCPRPVADNWMGKRLSPVRVNDRICRPL